MPENTNNTVNPTIALPEFTKKYVLENVIPVPENKEQSCKTLDCKTCAFYQIRCNNIPCEPNGKEGWDNMVWQKTNKFSPVFLDVLKNTDPKTVENVMQQIVDEYITIGTIVLENLTPYRCNDLFPACYLCHLGEHPDLCQNLGCSCRNPNEKDSFVNYVWHKKDVFDANNFVGVLGKCNPNDVQKAVQIWLSKLIQDNKLPSIQ